MNWSMAHLHLMINHLPIFGAIFSLLLLAWGLIWKRRDIVTVGLAISILTGAGAFAARQTGHEAEEQIEDATWANRRLIHEHEEAADTAFFVTLAAGAVALLALVLRRGGRLGPGWLTWLALVAMVVALMVLSNAALQGGYIRHPEVRPAALDTMPARSQVPPGAD